jgi:hypothetical protein
MCVIMTHICNYPHVRRSTSIPLKNPAIICRWGSARQKNAKGAENGNLAPREGSEVSSCGRNLHRELPQANFVALFVL